MQTSQRSYKDGFVEFFAAPSAETLPEFLEGHLGEEDFLDFKEEWPDDKEVARHILGMANSSGGVIIIGVKEDPIGTYLPVGISTSWQDKTDFHNKMSTYLPDKLMQIVRIEDFDFTSTAYGPPIQGKKYQIVFVLDQPNGLPYLAAKATTNIDRDAIYVRAGASSRKADGEEIERIINRRIETGSSSSAAMDLKDHLAQLRTLYGEIPKFEAGFGEIFMDAIAVAAGGRRNEHYPTESYAAFLRSCIDEKKKAITDLLSKIE